MTQSGTSQGASRARVGDAATPVLVLRLIGIATFGFTVTIATQSLIDLGDSFARSVSTSYGPRYVIDAIIDSTRAWFERYDDTIGTPGKVGLLACGLGVWLTRARSRSFGTMLRRFGSWWSARGSGS